MATSSDFSTSNQYIKYRIVTTENSYSTANNTSNITVKVQVWRTNSGYTTYGSGTCYVSINGTSYSASISTSQEFSYNSYTEVFSKTLDISHDSDGSKSIWISSYISHDRFSSDDQGYTVTLTKIPRYLDSLNVSCTSMTETTASFKWTCSPARNYTWYSLNGGDWTGANDTVASDGKSGTFSISGLTANTSYTLKVRLRRSDSNLTSDSSAISFSTYDYPKVSAVGTSNLTIGNSQTLTIYNPLKRSVTVKMNKDSASGTQLYSGTTSGTSITFTPTASTLYASIPSATSGKCVYSVVYSSVTKTTSSYTYSVNQSSNAPTFTAFSYKNTDTTSYNGGTLDTLTGSNQILVSGYSDVQVYIPTANKATAKNSATMSSYKATIGNTSNTQTYSDSAQVTFSTFSNVTTGTISVSATDSRGLSTTVSKSATIKSYTKPYFTSVTAARSSNGVGQTVTVTWKGQFWNASFGSVTNSLYNIEVYYRLSTSSTWSSAQTFASDVSSSTFSKSTTINGDLDADGFSIANAFYIRVRVKDKLATVDYDVFLPAGTPGISIYKNKVAIGQKYDTSDSSALQVNGTAKVSKNISIPKSGTAGYGLTNSSGTSIIRDHNNTNVSVDATGGVLYLGYQDTTSLNILNGKATIDSSGNYSGTAAKATLSNKLETINGRITDANVTHTYENSKAHVQLLQATSTMTSNKPTADGYILHFSWDNSGVYNAQMYYPQDKVKPMQMRTCSNGTWAGWQSVYRATSLYDNSAGTNGAITLSETSANFTYIEIFYGKGSTPVFTNSIKVYSPNGKKVGLTYGYYSSGNVQIGDREISISGTALSNVSDTLGGVNFSSSNTEAHVYTTNEVYIYKITGYR